MSGSVPSQSLLQGFLWLSACVFNVGAGTAAGQDINLSLDRVNANRNFTNKLWNAGKFILFNLEQVDDSEWSQLSTADFSSPSHLAGLPLTERWVISSLHEVRHEHVDMTSSRADRTDVADHGICVVVAAVHLLVHHTAVTSVAKLSRVQQRCARMCILQHQQVLIVTWHGC